MPTHFQSSAGRLVFHVTETIAGSSGDIWRLMTNWEIAPLWWRAVGRVWPESEDGFGIGSRIRFEARGKVMYSRVVEWKPEHRFALESVQGGVRARYVYTLEPDGAGTVVSLTAHCQSTGFPWRLISPLVRLAMRRSDQTQLRDLRVLFEGATAG